MNKYEASRVSAMRPNYEQSLKIYNIIKNHEFMYMVNYSPELKKLSPSITKVTLVGEMDKPQPNKNTVLKLAVDGIQMTTLLYIHNDCMFTHNGDYLFIYQKDAIKFVLEENRKAIKALEKYNEELTKTLEEMNNSK